MVLACDGNRSISRQSSSWAKIAEGDKGQLEASSESWPVIKATSAPKPDPKESRNNPVEDKVQKLEAEVKQLKADAALRAAEAEANATHILKLEGTLNDARKKILSLQPPQGISDDQIKQAFDDLCQNIEDFVDIECGGLQSIEDRFNAKEWTDRELRITESHITEDDIKLSKAFPRINPNIIMSAIFSLMYKYALEEDTWLALTDKRKEEEFLNELVEIMSKNKRFYNASPVSELQSGLRFAENPQLRRWRSEVFRALKGAEYHASKRRSGMSEWVRKLHLMVQHFVDEDKVIKDERLRSKIIEPAYHLADMIKSSTSEYRFGFVASSSSRDVHLEAKDANLHKLVDACTGIEEKFEECVEGCVGRLRLCIFPSLEKVQDDGDRVCMSKAFVVIDKLSKKEQRPTTAVSGTMVNGNT